MHLEIVVTEKWCHQEFGGTRISQKRFTMAEALNAKEYYSGKLVDSVHDSYVHYYIEIVEVI